jgi:poly-gamma-glutamate synthesis protein (capsule biosynthesis protein)
VKFGPRATGVALVIVLAVVAAAGWWVTRPTTQLDGRVVGLDGTPLGGVPVTFSGGGSVTTGDDGRFEIPSRLEGGWVTVSAKGFLSRTRAIEAGHETLVRLLPDDGHTLRLLFAGDVMMGRRYYDANDNGKTGDGLLRQGASAVDHERLLSGIAPLLRDADLSIVNLESPLAKDPWFPSTGPRPARFHPTKEFVFASAPEAAVALRDAGVDIVGLGNNHEYDLLDPGVASTQAALVHAGYSRGDFTGLGQTVDEAWQPAVREVAGQRIAVVACTTITGSDQRVDYVADQAKGGAARCEARRLTAAVRSAATQGDLVVVMIHGGFEYERQPSDIVRRLSRVAHEAGALLVVNAHPHVTGGIDAVPGELTAWTMGNLLFDQTVWPTFNSYALRVDVRDGVVADAYLEPFMLDGYRPVGVVGDRADWVARQAQSLSSGPWVVDDGSLLLDEKHVAHTKNVAVDAPETSGGSADPVLALNGACLPEPAQHRATAVGRDELWTGDFEDLSPDAASTAGALWNLAANEKDRQLVSEAAASGSFGVRLSRTGGKKDDIVLAPLHRLLVKAGQPLTVMLKVRGSASGAASLQLSWYNDTIGSSQEQTTVVLPVESEWRLLRVDVTVPKNAIATGLYIRLAPQDLARVEMDVDDVSLISWDAATVTQACDFARFDSAAKMSSTPLTVTAMPGARNSAAHPEWISSAPLPLKPADALPPGPPDSGWGSTE